MDKQSLILIALHLDLPDILRYCTASKKVNESICKNSSFWVTKMKQDFGYVSDHTKEARDQYLILYNIYELKRDPDAWSKLAYKKGYKDLSKFIIIDNAKSGYGDFWQSLQEAAKRNDMEHINFILDKFPTMSLIFGGKGAASSGNISLVLYFMEKHMERLPKMKFPTMHLRDDFIIQSLVGSTKSDKAKEIFDYLYPTLNENTKNDEKERHYGILHEAANNGKEDMVYYLIDLGFNNWNGGLEGAARNSKPNALKLVQFFLNKGVNELAQPLFIATYKAKKNKQKVSYDIIKLLIEKGALYEKEGVLEEILEEANGDKELTEYIMRLTQD